jgi:hypothetical protein
MQCDPSAHSQYTGGVSWWWCRQGRQKATKWRPVREQRARIASLSHTHAPVSGTAGTPHSDTHTHTHTHTHYIYLYIECVCVLRMYENGQYIYGGRGCGSSRERGRVTSVYTSLPPREGETSPRCGVRRAAPSEETRFDKVLIGP